MTKVLIIIIIAFLALFYVFTFIKWRKRKRNNILNDVKKYTEKYLDSPVVEEVPDKNKPVPIDFMLRDDLISETQEEVGKMSGNNQMKGKDLVGKIKFKF